MSVRWLLPLLMLSPLAQAGVYKWQDATGRTHYSASPPPGAPYEELSIPRAPTPAPTPPAEPPRAAPDKAAAPATREEACKRARENVTLLESDQPVTALDASGGQATELDAAARQQALKQARKDVAYYCD